MAKKFLGNMNIPAALNNTTWTNHTKQFRKATECVADESKGRLQMKAKEERQEKYEKLVD